MFEIRYPTKFVIEPKFLYKKAIDIVSGNDCITYSLLSDDFSDLYSGEIKAYIFGPISFPALMLI